MLAILIACDKESANLFSNPSKCFTLWDSGLDFVKAPKGFHPVTFQSPLLHSQKIEETTQIAEKFYLHFDMPVNIQIFIRIQPTFLLQGLLNICSRNKRKKLPSLRTDSV